MKPSSHVHFGVLPDEYKVNEIAAKCSVVNDSLSLSSSSSSIGQGSGSSSCPSPISSAEENEVQSSFRSPLNNMSTLEDSLPIKRGLSNCFKGKSRSFTSFADISSINDLAKPRNPYTKKRKWLRGHGSVSRNRIGYPPLRHCFYGACRKPLNTKGGDSLSPCSSGSGSRFPSSEIFQVLEGFKTRQKRSAPARSFSLSDLQENGR